VDKWKLERTINQAHNRELAESSTCAPIAAAKQATARTSSLARQPKLIAAQTSTADTSN